MHIYRNYAKLVKARLRPKSLKLGLLENSGWLDFEIGRRILHYTCSDADVQQTLDSCVVNPVQTQKMLKHIQALAALLPTDSVPIPADLSTLTPREWLSIEYHLIVALLHRSGSCNVPTQTLMLLDNSAAKFPAFLSNLVKDQRTTHQHMFAGLSCIGSVASLIWTYSNIKNNGALGIPASILFTTIMVFSDRLVDSCWNYATTGTRRLQKINEVSTQWSDVLRTRKFEDAILLGMLSHFYAHTTLSDWESGRVPNFLSMSPSDVYCLFSKLLDEHGEFDVSRYSHLLYYTAAFVTQLRVSKHGEPMLPYVMAGCDLSVLLPNQPIIQAPSSAE